MYEIMQSDYISNGDCDYHYEEFLLCGYIMFHK